MLIGFGRDASESDATDIARVQRDMDAIMPGFEVVDVTAHDWLADEFANGTWAIHRPGWYTTYHREMQRPGGPRRAGRLRLRQRLVGLHRRRHRVRPAHGQAGAQSRSAG